MSDYNLGTARGRIEIDSSGAKKGAAQAEQSILGIGGVTEKTRSSLMKTGVAATAAGGLIAAGFAYAVNKAQEFEHSMSAVQAVLGANQQQMDKLRSKALQLGKDTIFSAGESANAIEELAKNGLTTTQILNGAADATVNLAAAGSIDLPQSAEIASAAMNHFGLAAKELPHVADLLAASAARSAVDVGDLGESMKYVGPVAHTVGASLDDTVLALTAFGKFGIKGSMAGTTLRQMLLSLTPQSKAASVEMHKLGIITKDGGNEFYTASGKLKSMSQVSQVLKNALSGLTKQQQTAALHTIFGSRAIAGATVLAGEGAKGMNHLAQSMKGLTAADQAKTRMDNLQGSMEQLKGSLETAGITIGTLIIPVLRKLVDAITALVNKFLNLSPTTQKIIVIITALVGAFLLLFGALATLAAGWLAMSAAAAAAGTALLPLLGTLAAVTAGIMIFIAVVILVIKYHKQIWAAVKTAWNAIKGIVVGVSQAIAGAVKTAWNAVVGAIMTAVHAVIGFLQSYWPIILTVLMGPLGLIIALIIKHFDTVKQIFQVAWTVIKNIVLVAIGLVLLVIQQALRPIVALFKLTWPLITAIVKTAWNAIKAATQAVWNVIRPIVHDGINAVKKAIDTGISAAKAIWHAAWNAMKAVVQAVWNFIKPFVHAEINGIIAVIHTIEAIVAFVKGVFSRVYDAIVGAFRKVLGWLEDIGKRILAPFAGAAKLLWDVGVNIIQGLWNGMKSMIGKVGNWLGDQMHHLKDLATHPWKILSPSKYMYDVGKYIMQGLALGLLADAPKSDNAMKNSMQKLGLSAKDEAGLILAGVGEAYRTGGEAAAKTIAGTLQHIGIIQGKELKVLSDSYRRWVNKDLMDALTGTADNVQSAFDKINDMIKKIADARTTAAKALKDANKKVNDAEKGLRDALNADAKTKSQKAAKSDAVDRAKSDLAQAQKIQSQALQDFEFAKANSQVAAKLHAQAQVAEKALTKIANDREQLAQQIQTATQALQAAQEQYDQYAASIAGEITDTGALVNFLGQTDAEGNAIATTVQSIIGGMQSAIDQATKFAGQIDQLRKMGLSEDLINQIVQAGPEQGSELATAIINGGAEAIKQLNLLNTQLTTLAGQIGKSQADAMYGAGVAAAQGLLKGLQSQEKALMKEAEAIAAAITSTIEKALKIKSPSRVMHALGLNTVAGFIEGFQSQLRVAENQAARLAQVSITPGLPSSATQIGISAGKTRGGDGAALAGETYNVGDILIPVSDLEEMKTVSDFFDRIKQEARRGR